MILVVRVLYGDGSNSPLFGAIRRIFVPWILFNTFLLYAGLQAILGPLIFQGLPGSIAPFRSFHYVIQLFCYEVLFFLILDLLSDLRRLTWISFFLGFQVVFLIALGFYQSFAELQPIRKFYNFFEPTNVQILFSSFSNANHYGAYIFLASLLFLAYFLCYWKNFKVPFEWDVDAVLALIFGIIFILTGWSIRAAGARAVFMTYVFTLIAAPYFVFKHFEKRIWFLISIVAILVLSLLSLSIRPTYIYEKWSTLGDAVILRFSIYREMIGIFLNFPLFGVGLGTCKYISSLFQIDMVSNFTWAHLFSHHLELASETGIVGYGLFMGSLGWIGILSLKNILTRVHGERKVYGFIGFWALGMMFALSFIDEYLLTPATAILVVFFLAVLIRCAFDLEVTEFDWKPALHPFLRNAAFKMLMLLFTLTLSSWFLLSSAKEGMAGVLMSPTERNIEILKKGVHFSPNNAEYLLLLGDACYRKDGQNYLSAYEKAVRSAPTWARAWLLMGRAKLSSGIIEEGLDNLETAANLMPYNRDSYLYLILTYLRLENHVQSHTQKKYYHQKALSWLIASNSLERPFTHKDWGYVTMHVSTGSMPAEDKSRILKLLDEVGAL